MALTRQLAWSKYFRGLEVPTYMKKDSVGYNIDKPSSIDTQKISAGEEIIALNYPYNSKYPILRKKDNKKYRVTFNNIQKPGSETKVNLKPQSLGIVDKEYGLNEYADTLLNNISDGNLAPYIKNYLEALVLYYMGFEPLSYVQKLYNPKLPINDIKKDFGEVLGPISIINQKLLKVKRITIPTNAKIFFPSRPNEPLLDYLIKVRDKKYSISAKSGKTTNVVKPQDIIKLLQKDPKLLSKWQATPEFKILFQLAENTIVSGPILAASNLPGGPSPQAANDVVARINNGYKDNGYDYDLMKPFIDSNPYLSKEGESTTLNEIMYECEKIISSDSKNSTSYNKIFQDAISNSLIYVKFDILGKNPKFTSLVSDDFSSTKMFLRTKNGYKRRSDRMGIQL